jgi:hypothetical protein
MKRVYFRISSFALGSLTGGCWENDQLVSAATPEEAFAEALKEVERKGFAFETQITLCDRNGENLN